MKKTILSIASLLFATGLWAQSSVETEKKYLSGTGCDDMVQWDFMCTGGNNSGKWSKIGVPSCWECQGFGTFQYGMKFYGKAFPEGIADEKGMLFICPDGKNSWYWDSPTNASYRYETFVASELVKYTDAHYVTIPDRKARAVSGLSMGGHGALWLSIRHKDTFGAAGSMSGGVDIRPFPKNWEMKEQLGTYEDNEEVWNSHTVVTQLDKIQNGDLALIIDCGESDFFLNVNKELHQLLLDKKIDHDFITRPGGHTGAYWSNSIDYHLLFFDKFFREK